MTLRTEEFQRATVHSMESLQRRGPGIDLTNEPDPFRRWEGAAQLPLPIPAGEIFTRAEKVIGTWIGPPPASPASLNLENLNRLLFHSVALSAWRSIPPEGQGWHLRVNPSAGNLHPTETYIVVRGVEGMENGLYHYRVDRHALELRRRGNWIGILLGAACRRDNPDVRLMVVLTSAFVREAWKYGPRALRYCHLDAGHAAGAVIAAARALGWTGGLLGHFADDDVARVVDCRCGEEEPLLIIPLLENQEKEGFSPAVWSGLSTQLDPAIGKPSPICPRPVPQAEIQEVFATTRLTVPLAPPPPLQPGQAEPASLAPLFLPSPTRLPLDFGKAARLRRSALDHDPSSPLPGGALHTVLRAAMPQPPRDWAGCDLVKEDPRHRLTRCRLLAWRVEGLAPGAYRVGPQVDFTLIQGGDFSRQGATMCLGQSLAEHAGGILFLFGDLHRAAVSHGERGWRYGYFEAGWIGQSLALAAAAGGYSATGIGAFFDDDVARFWGMDPHREGVPLYLYTLARRPIGDNRLITITDPAKLFSRS